MDSQSPSKRRYGRLTFREPIRDQLTMDHDVRVLDLSLGGARVEHLTVLRPGGNCHLRLPLRSQTMVLNCQVMWSRAVSVSGRPSGEAGMVYHSGLMFTPLTLEVETLLRACLHSWGLSQHGGDLAG